MPEDKIPPYTVKNVPQADRDAMSAAARRSQETIGQWIVEAGRQRIARERGETVERFAHGRIVPGLGAFGGGEGTPPPTAVFSTGELVQILRDLRDVPGCRRVLSRARRLLGMQLGQHLAPVLPGRIRRHALPAPSVSAEPPAKG